MGRISVTWLELFFDLSVVLAVHNVSVPMESNMSLVSTLSYMLRVSFLWFIWQFMSTTINLANKRRSLQSNNAEVGVDAWLGWRETLCVILTTCFVTLMSNAAYVDNNEYYYGYFCLAEVSVLIDAYYQFAKYQEMINVPVNVDAKHLIRKVGFPSVSLVALAILAFAGYIKITESAIYTIFTCFVISWLVVLVKAHMGDLKYTPSAIPRKTMVEQWKEHQDHDSLVTSVYAKSSRLSSGTKSGASDRMSVLDKEHLQERYGLLTILLLVSLSLPLYLIPRSSCLYLSCCVCFT